MSLAGLVLAAGRGERLRPLTDITPKPLLTIGRGTLLDAALDRLAQVMAIRPDTVAVNAHWLADQIVDAVDGRAHVSIEEPEALGTAGAVGNLRDWLVGRDVLIANADAWYGADVAVTDFVAGWDGQRPRLLVVEDLDRPDFEDRWRFAGLSLLPSAAAQALESVPSGLYETVWSRMPIDVVPTQVQFVDCGTAADLTHARALATRR